MTIAQRRRVKAARTSSTSLDDRHGEGHAARAPVPQDEPHERRRHEEARLFGQGAQDQGW